MDARNQWEEGTLRRISPSLTCIVEEHVIPHQFGSEFFRHSHCPPGRSVSKTQMSAAHRDLESSAASARLLFDGDDVLHNTVRTPSRRGRRSLPAAAARFLCGRTLLYPDGQADVAAMCQVIAFTRNTYQSSVSPFSGRLKLLRETDWTLGLKIQ